MKKEEKTEKTEKETKAKKETKIEKKEKTGKNEEKTNKTEKEEKTVKKEKKKSKRKHNFFTRFFLFLIFVSTMIISGKEILKWIDENNQNREVMKNISQMVVVDENNGFQIDFNNLKQINPDVVGWIKVDGTEIEYPVVQTTNNDYYLTHNLEKKYSSSGWVFMDYKNTLDGKDKNKVIYAHNRRDGSMFGSLKNILTEEWQNEKSNLTIPFITENSVEEYEVFSVYNIEKEDYYITTKFQNNKDFKEFIEKIKSRSQKNFGVEVNENDQILTLSTCANNNQYRVVLHAKKISKEP